MLRGARRGVRGQRQSTSADLLARYRADPDSVDDGVAGLLPGAVGRAGALPARTPPAAAPRRRPPPRSPAASRTSCAGPPLRIAENMEASLERSDGHVPGVRSPSSSWTRTGVLINEFRAVSRAVEGFLHPPRRLGGRSHALKKFPRLNDAYDESGGQPARVRRDTIVFGLAVDVEKSGRNPRFCSSPTSRGPGRCDSRSSPPPREDVVQRARAGKLQLSDFEGHDGLADQPGNARDHGLGAPPHAGPGAHRRDRRDRVSGGVRGDGAGDPLAPRGQQGRDLHVDLRPPDHPGRRVRRVPRADRGAAARRRHEFYEDVFADLAIPLPPLALGGGPNPRSSATRARKRSRNRRVCSS